MTYGGTFRYYTKIQARYGVEFSFVDTSDEAAVHAAFRPNTKLLHLESPTNPTMRLCDIARLSAFAHERGALVVVDNTFCSPYLQKPLALGADIVMHSTTKFLNGHSDSIGGIAVASKPEHVEWLSFVQNSSGAILSPFDSWLVLRGIKTLVVRMERHEANGRAVAKWLAEQKSLRKVNYPGLPDHPEHALARRQMSGFGAMISFDLGSYEKAAEFLGRVRLCSLGESLGGVETLISHPASMTHASIPEDERNRLGVTPGLVRISVGLEDVEDLITDLAQALGVRSM
jgi:cystathionine beta-lyase/cystathionine gamma-synthase